MKTKDLIEETLSFDPLSKAKEETGSYTDGPGFLLGMDYAHARSNQLRRLMKETNDTYSSMPFNDFDIIAKDIGFSLLVDEPFIDKQDINQKFRIYWHYDYNIILHVDSWGKDLCLNGGHFSYQHRSKYPLKEWCYSSGRYLDVDDNNQVGIWEGYHDATNGCLRHYVNKLLDNGEFIRWQKNIRLYLRHHGEQENNTTEYWISRLPKDVQDVILVRG